MFSTRANLAILIAAAVVVAFSPALRAHAASPKAGDKAPDFTLQTHDDKSFTLSKLQGKRGALLVFFATWCPPCMAEVPHVKALVEKTRGKPLLVYGINVDQPKSVVVKEMIERRKVNYRLLLDTGAKVTKVYGVRGIPTIIGVDGNGTIQYRDHHLPKNTDDLVKKLTDALPKESPAGKKAE